MTSTLRFLAYAATISVMTTFPSIATAGHQAPAPQGAYNQNGDQDGDDKISNDAKDQISAESVPVIITYKQAPTSDDQGGISNKHGKVGKVFSYVPLISATVPGSSLLSLAHDPSVSYVSLDRPVRAHSAEYTAEPIEAPDAWDLGYTGAGIGVAVIDSGVFAKASDLASAKKNKGSGVVYSASFIPGQDTNDWYGHGTHVAGLIAGNGQASSGKQNFRTFKGIAPSASIISLKALDSNGQGSDSTVIAAIEAAISLKSTYNIRIINLSLGRPIYEGYQQDPLCQAVERAYRAGILVVAAAGNDGRDLNLNPDGYGTIEAPGNDPYILTVGAMKTNNSTKLSDDTIASYSSKGPSYMDHISKPDLVAPGNLVPSVRVIGSTLSNQYSFATMLAEYQTGKWNIAPIGVSIDYLPLSGTSMASAVASGAAALLFEADPSLTPAQAKALLMKSANKVAFPLTSQVVADGVTYNANYDPFTIGAGYLDIAAAINLDSQNQGELVTGDALSPVAIFDPISNGTYLQFAPGSLIGTTILWGSTDIYGAQAFNGQLAGSTILWGSTGVAGASDPNGFTALWATSRSNAPTILWGSSSPDATAILWGSAGTSGSTILWGSGAGRRPTILWGSQVPLEQ